MRKCPYCSEEIQNEAKKCRFCGEWIKEEENVNSKNTDIKTKIEIETNKKNTYYWIQTFSIFIISMILTKYFGFLFLLIVLIPSILGYYLGVFLYKKGYNKYLKIISYSSLLFWLLPIIGYFTTVCGIIYGELNKNKKILTMSIILFIITLINSIIGALIQLGIIDFDNILKKITKTDIIINTNDNVYRFLRNQSDDINQTLPQLMADNQTRVDKTEVIGNNTLKFYYTLINIDKNDINDLSDYKKEIKLQILEFIKKDVTLIDFRENKIIFSYLYKDKNNQTLFIIDITPEEYNDLPTQFSDL